VSSGIYCLKGSALDYIPDGKFFPIPDLINKMLSCNRPIGAYPIREFWMSIEHLEDIDTAMRALNGPPPV
jgi:NDP-sugar pyrophosphorylase family protein